jgi:hypothetical protein
MDDEMQAPPDGPPGAPGETPDESDRRTRRLLPPMPPLERARVSLPLRETLGRAEQELRQLARRAHEVAQQAPLGEWVDRARSELDHARSELDRRAIRPVTARVTQRLRPASEHLRPALERAWAELPRTPGAWRDAGPRLLRRAWARRWPTPMLVVIVVVSVLLGTLLPPLLSLQTAFADYQQLRALGDSGLRHLLAARDDLSGLSGLAGLQQFVSSAPVAAPNAPYTYLMQRQSGTSYDASLTIHPAPKMAKAGLKQQQFNATIDRNVPFSYGAPPPPAQPATATPTSSPSPTSTAGAPSKGGSGTFPDPPTVQAALNELRAAQQNFAQLRARLTHPDWVVQLAGTVPGSNTTVASVRTLADVGYDMSTVGIEVGAALLPVLSRVDAGPLAGDTALVTSSDLTALRKALHDTDTNLTDIATRLGKVDLAQLPLSAAQRATFAKFVADLPQIQSAVQQVSPWLDIGEWALGVGQSRHFLVQTLDRAELRPSGGFTGNYGVLSITNGKLEPFTLYNINDIEYGYKSNGWIYGKRPPSEYSWWPFGNWGLRDSNLSADFPTTAKINIQLFHNEGGGDVDGVIQFTTTAMAHLLNVTGPIVVPNFNETVTADNLEAKIHYYEEDPAGIAIQQRMFPNDHTHSLRKRFTQAVVQLVQDKVKHLPQNELVPMAKQVLDDMRAKDIQIYVTNPQVENQLTKAQATGAVDTTPGVDGYLMVQANVSVAKSTPYVAVTQHDDVTLDDKGGATHRLTITLDNQVTASSPIYGYPTYRDYVRIYAPQGARLTSSWGFDQQTPMCSMPQPPGPDGQPGAPPPQYASLSPCSDIPYTAGDRVCPDSAYVPNGAAYTVLGWDNSIVPALDTIGGVTSTRSDLPGHAMWGGYVIVPQACTARLTLRWYVPGVAKV